MPELGHSGGKRLFRRFSTLLAWPIIQFWLAATPQVWQKLQLPVDEPRAEAVGPDPDRILLLGPGKSSGYGVHTHQLGLGGHLAREVAALTQRGCSVDIVSDPEMSASDAAVVIGWARLERYDALVLTLGARDSLKLRSVLNWRRSISSVFDTISELSGGALHTFVLGIAPVDAFISLPAPMIRVINRNIVHLNRITELLCSSRDRFSYVPVTHPQPSGLATLESGTYSHWASELAPRIAHHLSAVTVQTILTDAELTLATSLDRSALTGEVVSARLTEIMHSARVLFDTSGAAITFHDHDAHWFTSTSGVGDMQRKEAGDFCSAAFVEQGLVAIEDTLKNERFVDHPWVRRGPRIRFYAGFPIVDKTGTIVGAVCVFDTEPRSFDPSYETLLGELARRVEAAM